MRFAATESAKFGNMFREMENEYIHERFEEVPAVTDKPKLLLTTYCLEESSSVTENVRSRLQIFGYKTNAKLVFSKNIS